MLRKALLVLAGVCLYGGTAYARAASDSATTTATGRGSITGIVADSTNRQPLAAIEVHAESGGQVVTGAFTDAFGRYTLHNLALGTYTVVARSIGYRAQSAEAHVGGGLTTLDFRLPTEPVSVQGVDIYGTAPLTVNTRTGDQAFQASQYHGSPVTTTSQILQQSMAGAVRAPTGEVHIRGQHAEYTYYVDGLPVPAGVSGSLNELFDPQIINHIDFKTGGWDAEYGNKNTAIVDVSTRVPTGAGHLQFAGYGGSNTSNGQYLTGSTNQGKVGLFFSGSRQESDMRQEPVLFDPASNEAINFHNHGTDYNGFGKMELLGSRSNVVNLDVNWSQTQFQVPYDSTGGITLDDEQRDRNAFVNLSWHHMIGDPSTPHPDQAFAGIYFRNGSLLYTPGANDDPSFVFFPDTTTAYNLSEDRHFSSFGLNADYTAHRGKGLEFKAGTQSSVTTGRENFSTFAADGSPGPASDSDLNGHDIGLFAQSVVSPTEKWDLRLGVRYDAHKAPFAGTQDQVSPRARVDLYPNASNTFWAYYGRLFLPTNVEDLRAITSVAQEGVATAPTLPERDHFYEVGYVHRFPAGVVSKLSLYRKDSKPGIDDNTVPGSAIVTSVNIDVVHVTGIEAALEVKPSGPLSGYLNAALCHAYGHGPITGGFFPEDTPEGNFDLDHDQRLSLLGSLTYGRRRMFASATGIYSSGLTNGADPDSTYGTGLFDFNKSIKVDPSFIVNASAGYAIAVGGSLLRPELYVDNLFDKKYLLKGVFFSGASVGRPRQVQFKLTYAF